MFKVIDSNFYGLYNAVCEGSGSRYDLALELLKIKNLQDTIRINRIESSQIEKEYFAPRPTSEHLVNMKLKFKGISISRDWRVCLDEYLKKFDWGI
jgi:dTDP-4-dehydrorhamnose reductase